MNEGRVRGFDAAVTDLVEHSIGDRFKLIEPFARDPELSEILGGRLGEIIQPFAQCIDVARDLLPNILDRRTASIEPGDHFRDNLQRAGNGPSTFASSSATLGAGMKIGEHPPRAILELGDIARHQLGGFAGIPCEALDLSRHRRETARALAGPRGLDRRVDRENRGLTADRVKFSGYRSDLLDRIREPCHLVAHPDDLIDQASDFTERR